MQMYGNFEVNLELLKQAGERLAESGELYWVVGGAGSGKTTICRLLSQRYGLQLYDMDERIYGAYHGRFTDERHPVNRAWSTSADPLAFLLDMTWEQFDQFNRAALPEYLDLLAEDLAAAGTAGRYLVDGGISHPALLAHSIPAVHLVGLAVEGSTSEKLWEADPQRLEMKAAIYRLPHPEAAWQRFLDFDRRLSANILKECRRSAIPVYRREKATTPAQVAEQVRISLGF